MNRQQAITLLPAFSHTTFALNSATITAATAYLSVWNTASSGCVLASVRCHRMSGVDLRKSPPLHP